MEYKIRRIEDFDDTDLVQQLLVLQNAKELLAYLWDESGLPYELYNQGAEVLRKAMSYVDDQLIHGGV